MGSLWQGRGLAKQFIHDGYERYEEPSFVLFLAETQIVFTETTIFLAGENGRLLETTQMNAMKSMRLLRASLECGSNTVPVCDYDCRIREMGPLFENTTLLTWCCSLGMAPRVIK